MEQVNQPVPANNLNHNGTAQPLPTPASAAPEPPVAEIDRVRDLIFGSQQREMERRFKTIERKIDGLVASIQEMTHRQEQDKLEMDNRLNALEERFRQQLQSLENLSQNNRREAMERLNTLNRQFSERVARLEQNFVEQHDNLNEGKVDRFDLGDLLIEAGMRLRKDSLNPANQAQ